MPLSENPMYDRAGAWDTMDENRGRGAALEAVPAPCDEMVGSSAVIHRVFDFIERVAPTDATVLIHGESGTGKELVARAIHRRSLRSAGPFAAINCAALAENLLESELFGHVRGSFTGALNDKKGRLELAHGGTLFLDEIGELPAPLQAKLLRALQEREFERVGGTRLIHVDVRVLAATNADLRVSMARGAFRQDLYFRLNVLALRVPPLRERREDIPALAEHFAARCAARAGRRITGIASAARKCLMHYDWPGNVRELENAIERAVVLGSSELLAVDDLPDPVKAGTRRVSSRSYEECVREFKRQLILDAIRQAGGSYTEAARILHVHPNSLHRLIRQLDLKPAIQEAAAAGAS